MSQVFEHWNADFQVLAIANDVPLQLAYDEDQVDPDCGIPGQIVGHTITAIQCRVARLAACPSRAFLRFRHYNVGTIYAEGWVDLDTLPLWNGEAWGRTWVKDTGINIGKHCGYPGALCHNCADVTWELTSINATDEANAVIHGYFYTDETCGTKIGSSKLVYAYSGSKCTMDGVSGGGSTEMVGSLQGEWSATPPFDVTTLPATDIVNNSVKLHGHVSKVGTNSSDITQYGFDIRQATEEEYSVHNEWHFSTPITTESLFSATFGGVTIPDNTSFYFRAKAINADGTWCYGEELTFDTGPFTVVTNDAADVTAVSATISGSATVDTAVSDVLIKKTGMHYGLDQYMNYGASFYHTITPVDDVDFETALSYLYPATTYYCVASAIAEVDDVDVELFGEVKEFTTDSTELTVYTRATTNISYTYAKLNMEALSATKAITYFGFDLGTTESYGSTYEEPCSNTCCSTYESKWVKCGITVRGLTDDTTYHFKARARVVDGEWVYGEDMTFTTRGEGDGDGECDDGMHHCPGTVTMTPTIRVSARGLSGKDVLRLKTDEQALGGSYIVDLDNSDDSLDNVDCLGPASIYMSPPTQTLKVTIVSRQTFSEEGTKYLRITCIDPLAELRQSSAMLATIGGFVFNEREFTDTTLHSEAYVTEYTADCWNKTIAEIINAITEGCIGITTTFPCNTDDCVVNTLTPHIVAVNAMTGVMDALSYVEGGLRWDGVNLVYIPPSLMSGMNIYSRQCALYITAQGSGIAVPNYVWCWGVPYDTAGVMDDLTEDIIVNWKADSYSVYRIGRPIHKHIIFDKNLISGATDTLKTDTLLTIATAKLARVQEDSAESIVVVLPTCKERLFNKVRASDCRGNVVTGVVHRIERFYEAGTGIYTNTLHLGGQLGAADTVTTVTNPSESVRID